MMMILMIYNTKVTCFTEVCSGLVPEYGKNKASFSGTKYLRMSEPYLVSLKPSLPSSHRTKQTQRVLVACSDHMTNE